MLSLPEIVPFAAETNPHIDAARRHLEASRIECLTVTADIAVPDAIPRVVDAVLGKWNQIDILVNNAGANWAAPAEAYPDAGWRKVMSLNIDASFYLSREIARRSMIPRNSGKIINMSSIAGLYGNPPDWQMETIAYNASKGALISLTKALAAEWGKYNINVNAICPGFFPSRMTDVTLQRIDRKVLEMTPLHRLGGDEDLKGIAVFLASEASRHITGQFVAVDGGCSAI